MKAKKMKAKKMKYFKNEIKEIKNLHKPNKLKIESDGILKGLNISIIREANEFTFSFMDLKNTYGKERILDKGFKNISLINSKNNFLVRDLFVNNYSPPKCKGNLYTFQTKSFLEKKTAFLKVLIPIHKNLDFFMKVQQCSFITDLGYSTSEGITIDVDEFTFDIGIIKDKLANTSNKFVFIECNKKISFEKFAEVCFSIRICLGYLTGLFFGNEAFYFAYTKKDLEGHVGFKYTKIRPQIRHFYPPVNANPFSYPGIKRKVADKYYKNKLLRPVNFYELGKFCSHVLNNKEFSHCMLLILEASSSTLLLMPSGLALAIEMLADIVIQGKEIKIKPISDKLLSQKIRSELKDIIKKYSDQLAEEGKNILMNKIENINQSTNRSRLELPFYNLDIILSDLDKRVLEFRNALLHGRVPDVLSEGKNRTLNRSNKDLHFSALRLQTLVAKLILKLIGFDNYIINHSKINEVYGGYKVDDDYFIKL